MTSLNDKLLAVPVPMDAKDFKILGNNIAVHWESQLEGNGQYFLPMGDFKIIGLCDSKEIGFNCEDLVDSTTFVRYHVSEYESHYSKYMNYETGEVCLLTAADSFRSLLQSKGLDSGYYLIIEKN